MSYSRCPHRSRPEATWALRLEGVARTGRTSERSTRSTREGRSVWIQGDPGAINSYSRFRMLQLLLSTPSMLRFRCLPQSARTRWCVSTLKLTGRLSCMILTRSLSPRIVWSTISSPSWIQWTRPCRTSIVRHSRSPTPNVTPEASWSLTWSLIRTRLSSQWARWQLASPLLSPLFSERRSSDWRCERSWGSRMSRTGSWPRS